MHMKATVTLVNWNSVHPTQMDFPSMIDPAKIKQFVNVIYFTSPGLFSFLHPALLICKISLSTKTN